MAPSSYHLSVLLTSVNNSQSLIYAIAKGRKDLIPELRKECKELENLTDEEIIEACKVRCKKRKMKSLRVAVKGTKKD